MDAKTKQMSYDLAIQTAVAMAKHNPGTKYHVVRSKYIYYCVPDNELNKFGGCTIEGTITSEIGFFARIFKKIFG